MLPGIMHDGRERGVKTRSTSQGNKSPLPMPAPHAPRRSAPGDVPRMPSQQRSASAHLSEISTAWRSLLPFRRRQMTGPVGVLKLDMRRRFPHVARPGGGMVTTRPITFRFSGLLDSSRPPP